ncbi:MAG: amino acid-binding ACT domain-containing protein [Acidimicrobiia bacterium]|nr:amino acid-binding ACT domain-containing protein [Acidimicrobiia bacterium]
MFDLEIHMKDQPGELATMGETLGSAGISVEGGGMWLVDGVGVAHFLVDDGEAARGVLERAGMTVKASRPVLVQRLNQDEPGQLGKFCRALSDAGVNIEVLYSDHDNQLVVAVDNPEAAAVVSESWMQSRAPR